MATSPPTSAPPLTLPKKRPQITTAFTTPAGPKRRKPSSAGPSALRQTSFPPENALTPFSEGGGGGGRFSRSPSVDSSVFGGGVGSAVSGYEAASSSVKGGKKRKRKGGEGGSVAGSAVSGRGRASGGTTRVGSLINGEEQARSSSAGGGEYVDLDKDAPEEEDEEGEEGAVLGEGGVMDEAAVRQHREHLNLLVESFPPEHEDRYYVYRRMKLKHESVRRLTNHTLSQSAPKSILITVSGLTKVFIGELVERARDVQEEWLMAEGKIALPKWMNKDEQPAEETKEPEAKKEATAESANPDTDTTVATPPVKKEEDVEEDSKKALLAAPEPKPAEKETEAERKAKERTRWAKERGPLTPDHLREAWRRYRMDRDGGGGGYLGMSFHGLVEAAPKMGGRRLFR